MNVPDAIPIPAEAAPAVAARHAEIARVMAQVERRREALAARLRVGDIDRDDARRRNAQMPGCLGQLWGWFVELPQQEQLATLQQDTFHRTAWQSLLQCSPFRQGRPRSRLQPGATGSEVLRQSSLIEYRVGGVPGFDLVIDCKADAGVR